MHSSAAREFMKDRAGTWARITGALILLPPSDYTCIIHMDGSHQPRNRSVRCNSSSDCAGCICINFCNKGLEKAHQGQGSLSLALSLSRSYLRFSWFARTRTSPLCTYICARSPFARSLFLRRAALDLSHSALLFSSSFSRAQTHLRNARTTSAVMSHGRDVARALVWKMERDKNTRSFTFTNAWHDNSIFCCVGWRHDGF